MESKIQEYLEKIYTFKIEVEFKDFRQYEVRAIIEHNKEFKFLVLYDVASTIEANVSVISKKIDQEIVNLFKNGYN